MKSENRKYWKEGNLPSFLIREIELMEKELAMDITTERLLEVSCEIGENVFEDTRFMSVRGEFLFAGFIMAKHPEFFEDIVEQTNDKYFEYMGLEECFYDDNGDCDYDKFYGLFCEFVNRTKYTKERTNIFLITIMDFYNREG